jgi:hypothetical protein
MKPVVKILALTAALVVLPAHAAFISVTTSLSGANESPPAASPGTGTATVTLDTVAHLLTVSVTFSGLTAPATAAHIHCCLATPFTGNAGVATQTPSFTGFPNATSGTYSATFNTTLAATWNSAFVTAQGSIANAEAALAAAMTTGRAYLNIHTANFPGGEIRGFLATPEPGTLALLGFGAAALALARRRALR